MKEFKTLEEAKAEALLVTQRFTSSTYCPLNREWCNEACICLVAAKTETNHGFDEKSWNIKQPFCDNAMFTGERYEQNTGY